MEASNSSTHQDSPVLLVCIYSQYGNIITHDYLHTLFSPFGNIVKILIFDKAKVWKTFVEYDNSLSAETAMLNLNHKVIFEDGSKMNIFRSKLKHVQLHNSYLGGVNYKDLKEQQGDNSFEGNCRKRRSTIQDYNSIQPLFVKVPVPSHKAQSFYNYLDKDYDYSSTSAKHKSESQSIKSGSFNSQLYDIDQQFRQLALESQEFRDWEVKEEINRRKSKTIVNPHSEQFLLENCPSKVLFVRSIPQAYDNVCIYNIFVNFGKICKVIFIKEKNSALIEFDVLLQAIQAKDEINYAKSQFKVFYSHYQSLILRKITEDEEQFQYKSQNQSNKSGFNPPTQILYITLANPALEQQIETACVKLGCPIRDLEWKQNGKDRWMCLVEFKNLSSALLVMGKMQGMPTSNGRKIKISFTRSKIKRGGGREREKASQKIQQISDQQQYL